MIAIGTEQLTCLAPAQSGMRAQRQREILDGMGHAFASTLDAFSINTPLRIAHFLAQVAHESDGFCTTEEYASGREYENRADLGNVKPGDGPLFKGRGLIQLTGRDNYRRVGQSLSLELEAQPLQVNDPFVYLLVSCVFWQQKGINRFCDADDVISVTQAVNGGQRGIDSRIAYLKAAKALVASVAAGGAVPPGGGMAVLHRGATGDAVALLQQKLAAKGYAVALDGEFGAATELAVRHLQAQAGVAVDGVVGAETWALLSG